MSEHTPAILPPRLTLDQVATAAAGIIAEARDAGLAQPYSVNAHDYGPPHASLYISERQDRDIWDALQEWADHYGSEVAAGPGTTPGSVYAVVDFRRDGIRYEVTAVIHNTPRSDGSDSTDDQSEPPAAA
jgi:hypothetical protein